MATAWLRVRPRSERVMASGRFHASLKQEIHRRLRAEIVDGRWAEGQYLPSFRELARQYDVSIRPVQQAMDQLEADGYVQRRHGRGTQVIATQPAASLQDAVAVCLEKGAHVYGTLLDMLSRALPGLGAIPVVMDLNQEDSAGMLRRLARGGTRKFIIHLHEYFKSDVFNEPLLQEALFVGAIHWDSVRLPRMTAVLTDPVAGARLWLEHLREQEHHRILVVAAHPDFLEKRTPLVTGDRLHYGLVRHGAEFAEQWKADGRRMDAFIPPPEPVEQLTPADIQRLLAIFEQPDPPTAVAGLRDYDTFRVQTALLRELPDLARSLRYLGYYDTPWSRAAPLPLTTVSIDLDAILAGLLAQLKRPHAACEGDGELVLVPPRLVPAASLAETEGEA